MSSVNLDHQTLASRTAIPRGASQLVRTTHQQLQLRKLLVVNATLLVTPELPDPCEQPCPVAVALREDELGLLLGDARFAVKGGMKHFHTRVTRCGTTSASVVLAGLASDAAWMYRLWAHLIE
jgi:hypothetical protein